MKVNKNHREIMRHIKILVSIDIEEISRPLKRRAIDVDISKLSQNAINDIHRVANSYGVIRVESNGYKSLAIFLL